MLVECFLLQNDWRVRFEESGCAPKKRRTKPRKTDRCDGQSEEVFSWPQMNGVTWLGRVRKYSRSVGAHFGLTSFTRRLERELTTPLVAQNRSHFFAKRTVEGKMRTSVTGDVKRMLAHSSQDEGGDAILLSRIIKRTPAAVIIIAARGEINTTSKYKANNKPRRPLACY